MNILITGLVTLVMLACLLAIPFGLPGLWLMAVVLMGLLVIGQVSWTFALLGAGAVALAEIAEFWVLKSFGERYGGSSKAFWGAVLGGMIGLFVGVPIPVVGPVITAFLGTFVGAGLVTFVETRSIERSARVGWGVLLARTTAVAMKVGVAVALTGATAWALLFGG
jgi:uncharacterized protein YqgC (DUF456 family)